MIVHLVLLAFVLVFMAPLFWLICAAFKTGPDLTTYTFLPPLSHLTYRNFRELFAQQPFITWIINSVFLAGLHTTVVVALSALGGFALAKYKFYGKRPLMMLMLATMLLPGQVLLPASYELMTKFGWIDTFFGIIVPGAVSVFGILLFMQAMKGVPDELLQAARVDGCSEFHIWWEIALPIVRPMLGAYTLMAFLGSWNSFIWPQIILQDERKYTLPIGLANMVGTADYQSDYGILMAGTLLAIVPIAVLFFILQKDFIAGLTTGAVKG